MQDTDRLTVEMTAAEWNQILSLLAEQPFKTVAPLISKIQQQAMAQDPSGPQAQPQPPRLDGAAPPDDRLTGGMRRQTS